MKFAKGGKKLDTFSDKLTATLNGVPKIVEAPKVKKEAKKADAPRVSKQKNEPKKVEKKPVAKEEEAVV